MSHFQSRKKSQFHFSRRTVLRGLGTALALPWLESQSSWTFGANVDQPPVRMCCWYVPNGVHLGTWFPKYAGPLVEIPQSLQPLSFARDYLNCFEGLNHNTANINGDPDGCGHGQGATSFLTGTQAFRSQDNVQAGLSVDQVYAQHVGNATRLPSLELGCESPRSGNAFGFSGTYKTHIAWRTPTSPAPYEINPRHVFDRLFGGNKNDIFKSTLEDSDFYRKSILDHVLDDSHRMTAHVSHTDRRRLDQYFTSVREVERRIQNSRPTLGDRETNVQRPSGIPDDFDEHLRLMCDLMVLAFQTDSTRACTFMLTKEATDRNYPWLGFTDGHHELSHHGNDQEKNRKLRAIDQYHISILGYMIEQMMSIQEANGTNLLDNSLVLYGSGISDGDRHDHINLPVILLGKGGGSLRTGRHWKYHRETPMSNLLLTMLQQAGVSTHRFGDSTEPLLGLAS
jgi:Protein of unknown function (DUF1552)